MPQLARHLQDSFEQNCPRGWRCRTEARVVTAEVEDFLSKFRTELHDAIAKNENIQIK